MTSPKVHPLLDPSEVSPTAVTAQGGVVTLEGGPSGAADPVAFADAMRRADSTLPLSARPPLAPMPTANPGELTTNEATKVLTKFDLLNLPAPQRSAQGTGLVPEAPRDFTGPSEADGRSYLQPAAPDQSQPGTGQLTERIPFQEIADPANRPQVEIRGALAAADNVENLVAGLPVMGGKIDVADLRNGRDPIPAFAQRQLAQRDALARRVASAPMQLNPDAVKNLLSNSEYGVSAILAEQQELVARAQRRGLVEAAVVKERPPEIAFAPGTEMSLTKPFSTFFGFITNGESQLYNIQRELAAFGGPNGKALSAADMLAIQLKMSHVSQQLELFTSMLNKGLESSKTVLNTQI